MPTKYTKFKPQDFIIDVSTLVDTLESLTEAPQSNSEPNGTTKTLENAPKLLPKSNPVLQKILATKSFVMDTASIVSFISRTVQRTAEEYQRFVVEKKPLKYEVLRQQVVHEHDAMQCKTRDHFLRLFKWCFGDEDFYSQQEGFQPTKLQDVLQKAKIRLSASSPENTVVLPTLFIVQKSIEELEGISPIAGPEEQAVAVLLLSKPYVKIIKDLPSTRCQELKATKTVRENDKVVFGTADLLDLCVLSADSKFARAAQNQDVLIGCITHPSRALLGEH